MRVKLVSHAGLVAVVLVSAGRVVAAFATLYHSGGMAPMTIKSVLPAALLFSQRGVIARGTRFGARFGPGHRRLALAPPQPTAPRRFSTAMASSLASDPPLTPKETARLRPSLEDVDNISYGKRAKRRGTGSRGVPHRINAEERVQWDLALKKGYVTIRGSGYRHERKGAPLANIFRMWCDAVAVPCITVRVGVQGTAEAEVEVDLSPLRLVDAQAARELVLRAVQEDPQLAVEVDYYEMEMALAKEASSESADAPPPPDPSALAAARAAVGEQAAAVRALKDTLPQGGEANADPGVKAAVAVLLERKAVVAGLEAMEEAAAGAGGEGEGGEEGDGWELAERVAAFGGAIWACKPESIVVRAPSPAQAKDLAKRLAMEPELRVAAGDWDLVKRRGAVFA